MPPNSLVGIRRQLRSQRQWLSTAVRRSRADLAAAVSITGAIDNFITAICGNWGDAMTTTDYCLDDMAPSSLTTGITNLFGEHLPIMAGMVELGSRLFGKLGHLNVIVDCLLAPVTWHQLEKLFELSMIILVRQLTDVTNFAARASERIRNCLDRVEEVNALSRFFNSCTTRVD